MICPKIFLIMCIFFFIDFSCYLFVGFLWSVCKFFGEGGGGAWPPHPLSSSVIGHLHDLVF